MSSEATRETIPFRKRPEKKRLNKRTIEALRPPPEVNGKPAQSWTYDVTTPRLAICCWSSGAKTWYWVGRLKSQMIRFKLGEYPEIAPEQASKLAGKVSADVANGIDPRQGRRQAREELTLAQLFDRYLEQHAKLHKRTWEDDDAQFRLYCNRIKSRPISSITNADVAALHSCVGSRGKYAANRLLALLCKLFNFAAEKVGFKGSNPTKGVQRFREESRDRFMTGNELPLFFDALAQEPLLFQDFFTVLLLTGARRGNVQAMRFDEIDFTNATWRIPRTKNHKPLTVHLVKEVVDILQRRHAESNGNQWVFPGGRKNLEGHLTEPKGAWARLLKRAGLTGIRIHDLRRTLGSWQAATGSSLPIIGRTLGHLNQTTTAIYARLNLDPVRQSVDTAVAAMMTAAKGNSQEGGEK